MAKIQDAMPDKESARRGQEGRGLNEQTMPESMADFGHGCEHESAEEEKGEKSEE
jgi:hypothetical protein